MDVFETIKEKVSIQYEFDLQHTLKYKRYDCPLCGRNSLTIYEDTGIGHCHSSDCDFSGDVIMFYEKVHDVDREEAVRELCIKYNIKIEHAIKTDDRKFTRLKDDMIFLLSCNYYDDFMGTKSNRVIAEKYDLHQGSFDKVYRRRFLEEDGQHISTNFYYKAITGTRDYFSDKNLSLFRPDPLLVKMVEKQVERKAFLKFGDHFDELSLFRLTRKLSKKARER
jgi:ribosomal protein L37AE/L43A